MNFDINKYSELIIDKLGRWSDDIVRLLPNIILSAIILVIGFYIARLAKRFANKMVSKISDNTTLNSLFSSVVYITFIGITIFTVLSILKLDKAVTSILAGAGIIGLALAFAFQDIAANFISGVFISFRRPLHIGDIVKVKDYMGKIEDINLRDTVLKTFQGQLVIIPNKDVFQNPIENYTLLGKRRFDLKVGVSYGDDLELVRKVALEAVRDLENLSNPDSTTFFYTEFADSSINFVLRMWIDTAEQPTYLKVGSEAIIKIKKAFDANNISIPFPIRTMDFGIKGGVSLAEMPMKLSNENNQKNIQTQDEQSK